MFEFSNIVDVIISKFGIIPTTIVTVALIVVFAFLSFYGSRKE